MLLCKYTLILLKSSQDLLQLLLYLWGNYSTEFSKSLLNTMPERYETGLLDYVFIYLALKLKCYFSMLMGRLKAMSHVMVVIVV